ncbi:MAG: hypothetical protein Q7S26_02750, partial [bacterium]|nr:hypothetical protein [bacterium]
QIGTLTEQVGTLTKVVESNSQKLDVLTTDVENLAAMTAKGFAELTSYVDGRFDVVEEKLGTLEVDVEDTNKRITEFVTPEIERHGLRIKTLEQAALPN